METVAMDRTNTLYVIIAVLAVAVVILGVLYYQEKQATHTVSLSLGDKGVSIQSK
jgi:hypothetical protein